jgi:hypothetical protein
MAMATELALGIAALLVAFALVWFGRLYSHIPFMNIGVVHVTHPAIVLVFIALGLGMLIPAFR